MNLPAIVRYVKDGEHFIGTATRFATDTIVVIEDAVFPEVHRATVADVTETNAKTLLNHINAHFQQARQRNESLKEPIAPGRLIRFKTKDGSAWYVITKVTRNRVDIDWRGFGAERSTKTEWGFGRKLVPIADVKPHLFGVAAEKCKEQHEKSKKKQTSAKASQA